MTDQKQSSRAILRRYLNTGAAQAEERQEQEIDAHIATWPATLRSLYMTLARIRAEAELMAREAGHSMEKIKQIAEEGEE